MTRQLTQTVRIEIHRIHEEASKVLVQLHGLIPSCPSNLSDLATTVTVAYDNAEATAQAEGNHGSGNARLAVRLLDRATARPPGNNHLSPRIRPYWPRSTRRTCPNTCVPTIRPQTTDGRANACSGPCPRRGNRSQFPAHAPPLP